MTAQTLKNIRNNQKGFTLIELLVVIGILAVLLAITLIAINPQRQFQQANDTKRRSDVNAILNAVHQYLIDQRGVITGLGTISVDPLLPTAIADTGTTTAFCTALVTEYIAALPSDPQQGDGSDITDVECGAGAWDTGYEIYRTTTDTRITVTAPLTELAATPITVTR